MRLLKFSGAGAARVRCGTIAGVTPGRCDDNAYTGGTKNVVISGTSAYISIALPLKVAAPDIPTILLTCQTPGWAFNIGGAAKSVMQDGLVAPYASLRGMGPTGFNVVVNWPNGVPTDNAARTGPYNLVPPVVDLHYVVID
jgi:hypothetical protein